MEGEGWFFGFGEHFLFIALIFMVLFFISTFIFFGGSNTVSENSSFESNDSVDVEPAVVEEVVETETEEAEVFGNESNESELDLVINPDGECGKDGGPCCGRVKMNETLDSSLEGIYDEQYQQHIYCDEGYECYLIEADGAFCFKTGALVYCGNEGQECCEVSRGKKIYVTENETDEVFISLSRECYGNLSCSYNYSDKNYYCKK